VGLDMADNQKNLQIHCKVGRLSIDVICLHPLLAGDSTKTSVFISLLNKPRKNSRQEFAFPTLPYIAISQSDTFY
jgi:hypothetical protein